MSDAPLPAIRPLDVFPITNEDGSQSIVVQDNSRIAPDPLALSPAGYFVLAHLDGERNVAQIQELFTEQFGVSLDADQILELVQVLDNALMLDNEQTATIYQQRVDDYLAGEVRDNRESWPSEEELRAELSEMLAAMLTISNGHHKGLKGLVAPHMDYTRGQACYRAAYSALRSAGPADRYVILGTNHFGLAAGAVATNKDFLTPLGRVSTDRDFLSGLNTRLKPDLFEHEYDHQREHSIELQVHLLQMLYPEQPFSIVPILCPDPSLLVHAGRDEGELDKLAIALRKEIAAREDRTIVIAGADLSHVGQRFGDEEVTTPEFLEAIAQFDQSYLTALQERQEDLATANVSLQDNPTRICSLGCIYTLARVFPKAKCKLLAYDQAVDYENETHVTCAALAYRSGR